MKLNPSDQEMVRDITRLGVRTAVLLRGVMLQKIGHETLEWGLKELAAGGGATATVDLTAVNARLEKIERTTDTILQKLRAWDPVIGQIGQVRAVGG